MYSPDPAHTPVHADLFPGRATPPITLDEFHHYLYWHNRGWGGKEETVDMVVSAVHKRIECARCGVGLLRLPAASRGTDASVDGVSAPYLHPRPSSCLSPTHPAHTPRANCTAPA